MECRIRMNVYCLYHVAELQIPVIMFLGYNNADYCKLQFCTVAWYRIFKCFIIYCVGWSDDFCNIYSARHLLCIKTPLTHVQF